MSEQLSTRRKFLMLLGLTAGATLAGSDILASNIDHQEILKLNGEQQEFMLLYEKWMDKFIQIIHIQKKDPDNIENHKQMMILTEVAEEWKPKLNEYMTDKTFAIIYNASIERMRKEI